MQNDMTGKMSEQPVPARDSACGKRSMITILAVGIVFLVLVALVWLTPDRAHSVSERRKLKQMPDVTSSTIFSGRFMSEFESYALDQFPLRDEFRSLKAMTSPKMDNNDIYVVDGVIGSMDYPLNVEKLGYAVGRIQNACELLLTGADSRLFFSIIPDKNFFMAAQNGYLAYDYDALVKRMTNGLCQLPLEDGLGKMEYIDIFPLLTAESYYRTDTHWKQECILSVANALLTAMSERAMVEGAVTDDAAQNTEVKFDMEQYRMETPEGDFYGVYYGQAALPLQPDKIRYLTNDIIDEYQVFDFENNREIPVYDLGKMASDDPYELFVGGPLSLVTIENPAVEEGHLIVFRDSFGSSIAPLLAQNYAKTTLIDIRYIQPLMLKKMVDFTDADVLFMYSSMVLNHSETLK